MSNLHGSGYLNARVRKLNTKVSTQHAVFHRLGRNLRAGGVKCRGSLTKLDVHLYVYVGHSCSHC